MTDGTIARHDQLAFFVSMFHLSWPENPFRSVVSSQGMMPHIIRMLYCRNMSGWKVCDNNQVTSQPLKMLHCFTQCVLCDSSDWKSYRWFWMGDWIIGQNLLISLALSLHRCRVEGCNGVMVGACVWRGKSVWMLHVCWCWQDAAPQPQHNNQQRSYNSAAWPGPYLTSHLGRNVGTITDTGIIVGVGRVTPPPPYLLPTLP